tara:strand:+ start:440 stop:892 length:453 start_codon:yes stop_codon:yes gene_type:complete
MASGPALISPIPNMSRDSIPVVCAIIEREGFVLLAKRPADKHLGGKWEFPGGKVETGESPSTAIVREIKEELGGEFLPRTELQRSLHEYEKITIEMIPIIGRLTNSSANLICHEHDQIVWVRSEELSNYDLAPADYPVLENYFKTLSDHA